MLFLLAFLPAAAAFAPPTLPRPLVAISADLIEDGSYDGEKVSPSDVRPGLDVACEIADQASIDACKEYVQSSAKLEALMAETKKSVAALNEEALKLKGQMPQMQAAKTKIDESVYDKAVAYATSLEKGTAAANVAWAEVYEIESSRSILEATMPALDEECVAEASDKCAEFNTAMESLEKVIVKTGANGG